MYRLAPTQGSERLVIIIILTIIYIHIELSVSQIYLCFQRAEKYKWTLHWDETGGGSTVLAYMEEKHWKPEECSQLTTAYRGAWISSYRGLAMSQKDADRWMRLSFRSTTQLRSYFWHQWHKSCFLKPIKAVKLKYIKRSTKAQRFAELKKQTPGASCTKVHTKKKNT